jgi:hypothetical protein
MSDQVLDNATRDRLDFSLRYNPHSLFLEIRRMRELLRPEYPAAVQSVIDTLKRRWNHPQDKPLHIVASVHPRLGYTTFSPMPPMRDGDTLQWAGSDVVHPSPIAPPAKEKTRTKAERLVGLFK